jgi:hypothetical protein
MDSFVVLNQLEHIADNIRFVGCAVIGLALVVGFFGIGMLIVIGAVKDELKRIGDYFVSNGEGKED